VEVEVEVEVEASARPRKVSAAEALTKAEALTRPQTGGKALDGAETTGQEIQIPGGAGEEMTGTLTISATTTTTLPNCSLPAFLLPPILIALLTAFFPPVSHLSAMGLVQEVQLSTYQTIMDPTTTFLRDPSSLTTP